MDEQGQHSQIGCWPYCCSSTDRSIVINDVVGERDSTFLRQSFQVRSLPMVVIVHLYAGDRGNHVIFR